MDGFFTLGTRWCYLQQPLILGATLFAIDMASAIIMVFFICFICDLASAILAMPDICGGIGLFNGFFIMQR